ncbi:ribosome biogenesis protein ytm1 [Coniosporium tulheliwenetii]|uniref:Ribosome biogenesis protein ytm1 n=1 Tax=Coniosporium tulheliwenetii TaxID=3383036 RepID=A0ACC2ZC18_9PEZI|nr:ribosome biogenesis protein ytm1 [Cladosporium sp. JES 115]
MASDEELRTAILQHVEHGGYPDSEDVAAAELPPSALPGLLEAIARAKEDVKSEIREISRDAAPDVDGWIAQAKQLQADIERSRATAHDIVQQAEAGKALRASADDASSKVTLLEKELQFNETLSATLERIRSISGILDNVQDAAVNEQMPQALEQLDKARDILAHLGPFKTTRVVDLLQERAAQMTAAIVEVVTECWNALLAVDTAVRQVTIKDEVQREVPININMVVEALSRLNLLDKFASRFSRDFENTILSPRLSPGDFGVPQVYSNGDVIQVSGQMGDTSVLAALSDLQQIIEYLSTRLPSSISIPLSGKLMPSAMSRLISEWLEPSIPTTLDGLHDFQDILLHVLTLADSISDLGWAGRDELIGWVERVPRTWLAKRKEAALASVRKVCFRGVQTRKQVERVETQTILRGDALAVTGNGTDDDWNAGWSDDESKPSTAHSGPEPQSADGEDDASAWGFDNEEAQASSNTQQPMDKGGDDADGADEEAWGWGDEDASAQAAPPLPARKPKAPAVHDGETRSRAAERELTLREHYTITAVPSSILEIIAQAVSDAEILAQPDHRKLRQARLRQEMESQRTILRDLLDTAQGFSNSTIHPFAAECDNAISMTVDRIREVNKQWKDVLSRSALLQSLGSLLSTVTNKMMNDIKDMSDISEEESKRLKHFCDEIGKLNDLFMQERPDGEKADMTGVYTPNWLKFQYLAEILESSLADIKWMWTEGELKLEFDADEIIELIEALFAESPYRRSAIAEIRRASRGR